jgi:hypothetical protein
LLAILAVENQSNVLLEKNKRRKDTNPGGLLLKYTNPPKAKKVVSGSLA